MDFPLPIRSFTSTMDYTTPLYVDTNIVYQIDETKFIGLEETSHALEPALIVDCNSTWETCVEFTGNSTITVEAENQDLYNLIESLDVEDTVLFPVDATVNILDLLEMTLELPVLEVSVPKVDRMVYTSVLDVHSENVNNRPLECGSSNCLTPNTDYSIDIYESEFSRREEYHRIPSGRLKNPVKSAKRKRHLSSANKEHQRNSIQIEVSSKRKKLDLNEFCLSTYSDEFCLGRFLDSKFSQMLFDQEAEHTSMFHFFGNPDKRFV